MYRCEVCRDLSKPGESCKKHTVHRIVSDGPKSKIGRDGDSVPLSGLRKEIAREIIVCGKCLGLLEDGVPLSVLIRQRGAAKEVSVGKAPEPKPSGPVRPSVNVQVGEYDTGEEDSVEIVPVGPQTKYPAKRKAKTTPKPKPAAKPQSPAKSPGRKKNTAEVFDTATAPKAKGAGRKKSK